MKIRTRLTLLFTLVTATILLAYAVVIYISTKDNREKEFYILLEKEALTKANLIFSAELDTLTLQNIYRRNREILNEVEVAIYNDGFDLIYHDAVDIDFVKETAEMLRQILDEGSIRFYQGDWQVVGLRFEFEDEIYILTAASYDEYGYNKLNNLLRDSLLLFGLSILLIFIIGHFFAKKVLQPVTDMTAKARQISATNLELRLNSSESADELSELANTFNDMLRRLENSFDAQKQFVSNIAHELRTPLSAIIGELELSLTKKKSKEEYQVAIRNALADAKRLVRISNSLLDLAKASYDPTEIAFREVRLDEVLLDAQQYIQESNPGYLTNIDFSTSFDNDKLISTLGNEYLLKVAFANILENGCKFSRDNKCRATISFDEEMVSIDFVNAGVDLSDKELKDIFKPFYRGENRHLAQGSGIGLSLTQKIIQLHKGDISASTSDNKHTVFTIRIPHL